MGDASIDYAHSHLSVNAGALPRIFALDLEKPGATTAADFFLGCSSFATKPVQPV